jgi:hypothetical protein
MIRRIAIGVVALVFLGLLGFPCCPGERLLSPLSARTRRASPESVARGEVLAAEDTVCLAISDQADCRLLAGME